MGLVGITRMGARVTVGMRVIVCISCDVSCLGANSHSFLIAMQDIWYEYRGVDVRRSSSWSSDRSDERFPRSGTKKHHLFARDHLELRAIYIRRQCFAGGLLWMDI